MDSLDSEQEDYIVGDKKSSEKRMSTDRFMNLTDLHYSFVIYVEKVTKVRRPCRIMLKLIQMCRHFSAKNVGKGLNIGVIMVVTWSIFIR